MKRRRQYSPSRQPISNAGDLRREQEREVERENEFNIRQMEEKTRLHMSENRTSLFDRLFINTFNSGYICEASPVDLVMDASTEDIQEIRSKCEELLGHERRPGLLDYWRALLDWTTFVQEERKATRLSVREDVREMLGGKSYENLCKLEVHVRGKLRLAGEDPDYWEALLVELEEFKIKQALLESHQRILAHHRQTNCSLKNVEETWGRPGSLPSTESTTSPVVFPLDDHPVSVELYNHFSKQTRRNNEHLFLEEAPGVPPKSYGYAAVKPRHFSWVFMRIEWTKYNQAHFNSTNPPPPTPQGYCFNIFYPTLAIEGHRPPTYLTERDMTDPENYQLLRFVGGPPYADLVFRIPSHRWELGHRMGFRCTFQDSILCLNFRFRRGYRR